ncbi:hypothetical protein PM082_000019 [Marasmius tenuissimus]|nr:hypothetical protein PM082_000019 [Marasmius tenuissimus]
MQADDLVVAITAPSGLAGEIPMYRFSGPQSRGTFLTFSDGRGNYNIPREWRPWMFYMAMVFLCRFTVYGELRYAELLAVTEYGEARDRVKEVHSKLQVEWTSLMVWLGALAAIVFTMLALTLESSAAVVSPAAQMMIIASGTCAVLGILLVTWFIWNFCWTGSVAMGNVEEFMRRARDVNRTYVSFALGARIPVVLMVISALNLAGFMTLVTYNASKALFWFISLPVMIVMWGQFPIYAFNKLVPRMAGGLDAFWDILRARFRSLRPC